MKATPTTATLVLIRGLPGSGKSYIAQELVEHLGTNRCVMLDPDATDYGSAAYKRLSEDLTAQGVDEKFHPYRFLRGQAHAGIEAGKVILWNQPFTNRDGFQKTIINLQTHASEHNVQLLILVVQVILDPAIARQRVQARKQAGGHGPSEATFQRFTNDYVSFADEGWPTVDVAGDSDISQASQAILDQLEQLWAKP